MSSNLMVVVIVSGLIGWISGLIATHCVIYTLQHGKKKKNTVKTELAEQLYTLNWVISELEFRQKSTESNEDAAYKDAVESVLRIANDMRKEIIDRLTDEGR